MPTTDIISGLAQTSGISNALNYSAIAVIILVPTAILAGITWYIIWRLKFNIEAKIYTIRGSLGNTSTYIKTIPAKIVEKNGVQELWLMRGKKVPMPDNQYFFTRSGYVMKRLIHLQEDNDGGLHPIHLQKDEAVLSLKADPKDVKFWFAQSAKEDNQMWNTQSAFEKWAPIIVPITFILIVGVLLLVNWYQLKQIAVSNAGVIEAITKLVQTIASVQTGGVIQG